MPSEPLPARDRVLPAGTLVAGCRNTAGNAGFSREDIRAVGRRLSLIETGLPFIPARRKRKDRTVPVVGVTGSGGSGKSTVIDELLGDCLRSFPTRAFAVIALDPTRQKSGGALLGDRLRMNFADPRVFMRSMATRPRHLATNETKSSAIASIFSSHWTSISSSSRPPARGKGAPRSWGSPMSRSTS